MKKNLCRRGAPSPRTLTKQYVRFCIRQAEAEIRLKYYESSLTTGQFPPNVYNYVRRSSTLSFQNLKARLDVLIEKQKKDYTDCQIKASNLDRQLKKLDEEEYMNLRIELNHKRDIACSRVENRFKNMMKKSQIFPTFPEQPNKYVFNLTKRKLSDIELEALSLGPKFCIASRPVNNFEDEANLESFFHELEAGSFIMPERRGVV